MIVDLKSLKVKKSKTEEWQRQREKNICERQMLMYTFFLSNIFRHSDKNMLD